MSLPKSWWLPSRRTSEHSSLTRSAVSNRYTPMFTRQCSGSPGIVGGSWGFSTNRTTLPRLVHLQHAELARPPRGDHAGGQAQAAAVPGVEVQQFAVVHAVDVVAREDQHPLGLAPFQQVDVLVDRVGGALVPLLADPVLGRDAVEELVRLVAEDVPAALQVLVQGERLVLGQHVDLPQVAVDAVAEGEIDDAVGAAEGHGRLGTVLGQRIEALPLAPGQDQGQGATGQVPARHECTPSWRGAARRPLCRPTVSCARPSARPARRARWSAAR